MATANNLGTAYIRIAPQTEGIRSTIQSALSKAGSDGGESFNKSFSLKAGAIAGAISAVTQKAITAITSQFDAAVSRVDTLNVFPKVMKNLGYETNESAESLDRLSTRIEGLPTTLDEIVTYTQRLASSMNSLAKGEVNATDLALAFNDAALSGGKGQVEANRAFEQFVQIIGRGRPMMQDWKIMLEVMPGQLKQMAKYMYSNNESLQAYAKAAGKTAETLDGMDLYEWISADKNAYAKERLADFTEAMIKLDKEGGAGIVSFQEQVKDSTQTIGTALRLIPVRITKALANVISAFGAGDVYSVIDKFTKKFKDIGDWVVKYIVPPMKEHVIPAIKNVLIAVKGFIEYLQSPDGASVKTLLGGMLGAFIALKTVIPIISGITNAVKVLGVAGASSLGLLAAGITGLMVTFDALNQLHKLIQTKQKLATTLANQEANAYVSLDNAIKNVNKARETEKKILQDLDAAKKLQNDAEYQELVAKQNLAAAEEAYNAILADSNATADQKRMKQLEMKAAEDAYTEAIKKRKEAVQSTITLDNEYRAAQYTGIHQANQMINLKMLENKEYGNLAKRLDDLKNKQMEYTDAQGVTHRMSKERMAEISDWYAELLGKNDKNWNLIMETAQKRGISYVEAAQRVGKLAGEDQMKYYAASIDKYSSYALDASATSLELIQKELEYSWSPLTAHWAKALENCRLLGINVMGALDDGMKSQISRINDTMTRVFGTGIPNALKQVWQIHSPSRVFMDIGEQVGLGLIQGLDAEADAIEAKAEGIANSVVAPFSQDAQMGLNASTMSPLNRVNQWQDTSSSPMSQVIQNNTFNQVADDLDVKEASKLLGFEVATAI